MCLLFLVAPTFTGVAGINCTFPFRFKNVLYYGCTNVSLTSVIYKMCATVVDTDYNAMEMGWCSDLCHVQCEYTLPGNIAIYDPDPI
jgi:hypothetical protein